MYRGKIIEAWNSERLQYQQRYSKTVERFEIDSNEQTRGAMLEMSYVLISVFGLTSKEVEQVERFKGFTEKDIENEQ